MKAHPNVGMEEENLSDVLADEAEDRTQKLMDFTKHGRPLTATDPRHP